MLFSFIIFGGACAVKHTKCHLHVEIRGQLPVVGSLIPPCWDMNLSYCFCCMLCAFLPLISCRNTDIVDLLHQIRFLKMGFRDQIRVANLEQLKFFVCFIVIVLVRPSPPHAREGHFYVPVLCRGLRSSIASLCH